MSEGDLVMWHGKQTEHTSLKNRVVYQVMQVEERDSDLIGTMVTFKLRPAFDIGQPMGVAVHTISWSSSELRKVTLVDLGVIRLSFDNFIREYARMLGMETTDNELPGT